MEEKQGNSNGGLGLTDNINDFVNIQVFKYSFWFSAQQQMMRSWNPRLTLCFSIIGMAFCAIVCGSIGAYLYINTTSIYENESRYDTAQGCSINQTCSILINFEESLTNEVYFYYQISTFYQNHRGIYFSKSDNQLKGNDLAISELESCNPVIKNSDLSTRISLGNNRLNNESPAYPCGLLPRSAFNDTFALYRQDTNRNRGQRISLTEENVAWVSDQNGKFKNLPESLLNQRQWLDIESDRFAIWMRTSPGNTIRKIYAKVPKNALTAGNYVVEITNNWDASRFNGQKSFIIAEVNSLGGRNVYLAVSYLVVAGSCTILGILYLIRKVFRPRGILIEYLQRTAS